MNSKLIFSLLNRKHSFRPQSGQQFPYLQLQLILAELILKEVSDFHFILKMPIQQTDSGSERYYRWKQIIPLSLPLLSEPVKPAEGLILISSDPAHSPSFTRSISLPLSSTRYSHLPFSSHSANLHYHALDQRAVGWTVLFTGNHTHTHTHSCDYTQPGLMTQLSK